jgi:GDP-L-fucose synthase
VKEKIKNFFKSKSVLVTGATGFVGQNLIKRLRSYGAKVRCTYHTSNDLSDKGVEAIQADLRSPRDCNFVCKDIDFVYMCAANSSGAKIIEEKPLEHLTPNIIMNLNMLEAAHQNNIKKFLFISSHIVYPLTNYAVKEDDVNNQFFEKYHIAGWMKRFSEITCEMYSKSIKKTMPTIIIRSGNLYGPHDKFDWEKSKVIPALIRRVVEKHDPLEVWGDGKDLKDFLYIDDFVDGLIMAMFSIDKHIIMNLASGIPITIQEVLDIILKIENYNVKVNFDTTKPTMIPKRLIDTSFAKKIIKWNPKIKHFEGLSKTIEWYKKSIGNI